MAEHRLSTADVVERLAAKSGLTTEQVKAVLQAQAELAYSSAASGFPIPGIGVFAMDERPASKIVMRFGPMQGEERTIPAKRTLKFRVSRLAKAMVLGPKVPMPDIFQPVELTDFNFSSEATQLPDASTFTGDLGAPFTLAGDGSLASITVFRLPDMRLPSGRIIAADGIIGGGEPFSRSVPPGVYPLALAVARLGPNDQVALAIIRFSNQRVVKWEVAAPEGENTSPSKDGQRFGYAVDSGTGSFSDFSSQQLVDQANETGIGFSDRVVEEMNAYESTRQCVHIESPKGSIAIFSSGGGDGRYTSYFGLDESGNAAVLVTDFSIVNWGPVTKK